MIFVGNSDGLTVAGRKDLFSKIMPKISSSLAYFETKLCICQCYIHNKAILDTLWSHWDKSQISKSVASVLLFIGWFLSPTLPHVYKLPLDGVIKLLDSIKLIFIVGFVCVSSLTIDLIPADWVSLLHFRYYSQMAEILLHVSQDQTEVLLFTPKETNSCNWFG